MISLHILLFIVFNLWIVSKEFYHFFNVPDKFIEKKLPT